MWPYGYTYTNVPADMTADDHAALVYIGKKMASTNGYKPEQASDLYISSGTSRDYLYGTYRIFSYTFEMSVKDYPDDSMIAAETGRNKEAVLYLMERAWCPLSVRGATVTAARCGAYDDDMEVRRGWTVDPGRDRHGAVDRPVRPEQPGRHDLGRREAARDDDVRVERPGHRARRRHERRTPTTSMAGPRSGARAIKLPTTTGQKLTFALCLRPRRQGLLGRSVPGDRRGRGRHPDRGADRPRARRRRRRRLADAHRSRWIAGPARPSTCGSSRRTAAPNNLVEVEIDDVRITRGS